MREIHELVWQGAQTVAEVHEALARHRDVEVELPASYHHALFEHLYPDADPAALEEVDVTGGAELIEQVAQVQGLESLAELAHTIAATPVEVCILSPAPKILIHLAEDAGRTEGP